MPLKNFDTLKRSVDKTSVALLFVENARARARKDTRAKKKGSRDGFVCFFRYCFHDVRGETFRGIERVVVVLVVVVVAKFISWKSSRSDEKTDLRRKRRTRTTLDWDDREGVVRGDGKGASGWSTTVGAFFFFFFFFSLRRARRRRV